MSNQIIRNGPPAWVLAERNQKAAELATTDSQDVTSNAHSDTVTKSQRAESQAGIRATRSQGPNLRMSDRAATAT